MDKKGGKKKSAKLPEEQASSKTEVSKKGSSRTAGILTKKSSKEDSVKGSSKRARKLQIEIDKSVTVRDSLKRSSAKEALQLADEAVEMLKPKPLELPPRTKFLLQEYREFKAARTIQAIFRGWSIRHMIRKWIAAAGVIQRNWKGFCGRRNFYHQLENAVQKRVEEYFDLCAAKIQAIYRGYWVRENIHDQYRLVRIQLHAAEDLLHCVAFKLHHLIRTYQIPGIYSIRNSHCFSKVEQLLYAMHFKQFNDRVRMARKKRENIIEKAKKTHKKSAFMTQVPYVGPQFEGICEPKCCELYKEADADLKMGKILSVYAKATRTKPRIENLRNRNRKNSKSDVYFKIGHGDFCGDVIASMKKWNILGANNLTINEDVFKSPENVENFLNEIQEKDFLQARCHCHMNIKELFPSEKQTKS